LFENIILLGYLLIIHMKSAEQCSPLNKLVFCLSENYLKRLFINRVLTHGDEHLEGPRKLLSISHIIRSVLFKMLVESIKDSLEMHNFVIVIVAAFLN